MGGKELKKKYVFEKKEHLLGGLLVGTTVGTVVGAVAGFVAGVTAKYAYDKYIKEKRVYKKLHLVPKKILKRPYPATVKSVYPDRQTFSRDPKSPIWIEFDASIDSSTVTKDTVIVKSSASENPIEGILDAGTRTLMFRPSEEYPLGEGETKISVTLIGTDTGSGVIKDAKGVPFDGDKDGEAGGDFTYEFKISKK
ncbi:MAG: Ig-like domain-containing protein [Methanosarcina sp.]